MASTFTLEVLAPDRVLYQGEAEMVILRGAEGELGILAQHMPLVTPLRPCVVRIRTEDGREDRLSAGGGFLEVRRDKVTILSDSAELPADIDAERAERARAKAQERIGQGGDPAEMAEAKAALARAEARLQAVGKQ